MFETAEALRAGLGSSRESAWLEFKAELATGKGGAWLEFIKDLVALANSGGGWVVIGVDDNAKATGFDARSVLDYDLAKLVDAITSYTGESLSALTVHDVEYEGRHLAVFQVPGSRTPLAFQKEGGYQDAKGKDKTAFVKGAIYVRHGPKSEPATTSDVRARLQAAVELEMDRISRDFAKVLKAPPGAEIVYQIPKTSKLDGDLPVRITSDPDAPAIRIASHDDTHPYRQKDVQAILRESGIEVNRHDLRCINVAHRMADKKDLYYASKHAAPQYSHAYIQWVLDSYAQDKRFFANAKKAARG